MEKNKNLPAKRPHPMIAKHNMMTFKNGGQNTMTHITFTALKLAATFVVLNYIYMA